MTKKNECEGCGKVLLPGGAVSFGSIEDGYRELCMACFNTTIAEYSGIDFEHADFDPVTLTDAHGVGHEFHFNLRLAGDIVVLDAFELKGGERTWYDFQVIGDDPEVEPLELFGKLLAKLRRALARKHIEVDEDGVLSITKADTVRAIIQDGPEETFGQRIPTLIIDGEEVTWKQFGHMLMTYVGFGFKLEVYDKSDER